MPFFAAGVHPVVTYNIVLLLSFVASAFALYLLVERLTGSAASAFVAALIFEFSPYRFEHYAHLELLATVLHAAVAAGTAQLPVERKNPRRGDRCGARRWPTGTARCITQSSSSGTRPRSR